MDESNDYKMSNDIIELEESAVIRIIRDIKYNDYKNFKDIVDFYLEDLTKLKDECKKYDDDYAKSLDSNKKQVEELKDKIHILITNIRYLLFDDSSKIIEYLNGERS